MTRRERIEARIERRREWAEGRERKASAAFSTAHNIVKDIPLGQPILIGHHSERRHRAALDRMASNRDKGVECSKMADEHRSKAANLEAAVDRAIYRDDVDAVERLTAKLADLEAQRAAMKAENAAYRRGDAAFAACLGVTLEAAAALRLKIDAGYSWCRQPHPAYSLQNLGGTITKERKRLAQLIAEKTPTGSATVAPTGETATARAGLVIVATMTTPAKAWKKPRPVWNVTGNLAFWRPLLVDNLGGTWYRGVVSFWSDPADAIEAECRQAEADARPADPVEAITNGRTIWNSDGTDGPCLICPPPSGGRHE